MSKQFAAFVLMPFDPDFRPIYDDLIKPALEEAGYSVARADSSLHQQSILKGIVRSIAEADLVVADLTSLNANVLYELGLSHGLRAPTVLISQSLDEVPFDLRPYRVILYDTRFDLAPKLKSALAEIASEHRSGAVTFGSPVADYLPPPTPPTAPGTATDSEPKREVPSEPPAEKGILDFLVEGDQAATAIADTMTSITADIAGVGDRMNQHTETLQEISKSPGPGIAARLAKISNLVAADMDASAQKLDLLIPDLESNVNLLEESYTGYVNWYTPQNEEQKSSLRKFRETLSGLKDASEGSLPSIASYREAVSNLRGISAGIGGASRRLSHAIDGLIDITQKVVAFSVRTIGLIDEKLSGQQPSPQPQ